MTSSKRPFRLGLKSKSADTDYTKLEKGSKRSTYVHPLAGQQDIYRKPVQPYQAEAGPSRSRESLNNPVEQERDVETLSETNGWFRSLATDEESLYSSHSPVEADFGSLSATLQEVVLQQQLQNDSTSNDFSIFRQPDQQFFSSLTPEKKQAELLQMAQGSIAPSPPIREGGILSRLRRISKKEKSRAAREASGMNLERIATLHAEENEPSLLPSLPSSTDLKEGEADPMLSLKETALKKTPMLEMPRRDRIQSIQPSLVDTDSIYHRHSMSGSLVDFDEEDLKERLLLSGSKTSSALESEQFRIGLMEEDDDMIPDHIAIDRTDPFTNGQSYDSEILTPSEFGQSFESPLMDSPPSTPADNLFHEASRSEYTDAASRQPSSYDSLQGLFTSTRMDEQDDEAMTPRAAPDDNRNDYFAVTPFITSQTYATRSSISLDTASTPTKAIPVKKYTWYQNASLDPQQRHYFLRHVLSRELLWEFERLFLVSNSNNLSHPSPSSMLPRSDIGYFKQEIKGLTPNLPLIRFLYTHILSTCPFFGPAQPIEGAAAIRARKAGAKQFLEEAILPYLRFRQQANIARGVDVNGEWPNELFDSPSTSNVMMGSIFKFLVKFVSAVVSDEKGQSLSWPDIPTPSTAAYICHRVAPNKLKQGGMEVNIVGARRPSLTKDCELLLSVRRFGFPLHYVVRSESDFYDFALRLADELGRKTRIRAVPRPIGLEIPSISVEEMDRSSNELRIKKSPPVEQFYGKRNTSQNSLQSLTRPKPVRLDSNGSLARLKGGNTSSASFGSNSSPRPSNELARQGGQTATTPSTKTNTAEKSRFIYKTKADSSVNVAASRTSLGNTANFQGRYSPPITRDDEARRKQLRAWLRDTLSVRGAGHAKETKAFLETGSLAEKEIKAATKKDVERRADIDAKLIQEREVNANNASDEIIELQKEMKTLWKDCIEGDGVLKALEAVRMHDTFSSLPLPYQRVISWTNLQVAQFIHHVFLNSNESRSNFDRATELLQCIPWNTLSLALREPTGLMIQKFKSILSSEFIIKKFLALQLEDVPVKKVEVEIASLKKRLGSTIMRKLERYVISDEWQKRIIRKASKKNNIPLVAAIVRGDDKPLLAADGIKRIMKATRLYQDFIKTQPTYEEKKAKMKVNVEFRLIADMQRALKSLCLRQNGKSIREALTNQLKKPLEALLEPLFSLLKRLHRSKILTNGKIDVIIDLQEFLFKLFDVLGGLKIRIQGPWRSLSTLTLFLDDVIPSWYRLLHQFSNGLDSGFLQDITQWLQNICSLLSSKGSSVIQTEKELAPFWQPPKGGLNQTDKSSILELIELGKVMKSRSMESACRWAAGDIDADYSIQLLGQGGKTRITPFQFNQELARPSTSLSKQDGLDVYLTGLRSALSHFM